MNKYLTIICLLFFSTEITIAQKTNDWCDGNEPKSFANYVESVGIDVISDLNQIRRENIYKMPVKWHVMHGTNPNGSLIRAATWDRILDAMCTMNAHYDSVGFKYILNDPVDFYINNTYYNLASKQVGETMMGALNQANRINAYLINLTNLSLCGWATFPGTGAGTGNRQGGVFIGVNGNCFSATNTTVSHELGHYFGLAHPFQTTSDNPTNIQNAERVTRNTNEVAPRLSANCATTADRFCDTRADYIGQRWNCNSTTFTQRDVNNDLFNPDPSLFMSYSDDACQSRFSPQQSATMVYFLLNARNYLNSTSFPNTWQPVTGVTNMLSPSFLGYEPRNFISFRWNSIPNATRYLVQVSSAANFSSNAILLDTVVADTSFFMNATNRFPTSPTQVYRWRVRGFNPEFTCGSFALPNATQGAFYLTFGLDAPQLESASFRVFPSLLTEQRTVQVQLSALQANKTMLRLFDISGKMIATTELSNQIDQQFEYTMPSDLGKGIYLLQITHGNQTSNHKLVLQ